MAEMEKAGGKEHMILRKKSYELYGDYLTRFGG